MTRAPRAIAPLSVTYSAGRRTAIVELIDVVNREADWGPKIRKLAISPANEATSTSSRLAIASRTAPSACARIVWRSRAAPTALKPSIDRLTEWLSVVIASDSWTKPASRNRISSRIPGTMLFPSNRTYAVRCPPVSITSASMPRAPIPWSAVAKPRREAYPTRTRSFGACSAASVAAFAAWMISWLRWLPNSVRPTPGSRQLCASTKIASRAPRSRASWTAAWPVALSMSSVGFGANEATISTTSPKACASADARAYVTRHAVPTFGPKGAAPTISRTASETFFTSAVVAGFSSWVVGPWATSTFGVRSVRPRAIFEGRSLPLTNPIGPGCTPGAMRIALIPLAVRKATPPTRTRARTLIESKNVSSSAMPASSCSPYWSSVDRRSFSPSAPKERRRGRFAISVYATALRKNKAYTANAITISQTPRWANNASPIRPSTGWRDAAGRVRTYREFEVAVKITARIQRTAPYPRTTARSIRNAYVVVPRTEYKVRAATTASSIAPTMIRLTETRRNDRRKWIRPPRRSASGAVAEAAIY